MKAHICIHCTILLNFYSLELVFAWEMRNFEPEISGNGKASKKQQTKEDFPNFHRASVNSTSTVWCFTPPSENRLCCTTQLLFFKCPSEHPVSLMDPSKERSHLASLFKPLRTLFICLFVFLLNQKMDGYLCF